MKADRRGSSLRRRAIKALRPEQGVTIIVAVAFVMVFLIIGLALVWLVISQTRSTELERTDVKAFNVAEAGVDAGMLSLKQSWPEEVDESLTLDNAALKTVIQENTEGLWDPTRSSPEEFIQVQLYDNVDENGATTSIAYPLAPAWDSNADGMMFVDSTANVDDDRHRILILAQRQTWNLTFPNVAMYASDAGGNGSIGLRLRIDYAPDIPDYVMVNVSGDLIKKGIWLDDLDDPRWAPDYPDSGSTFESIINDALLDNLMGIAMGRGTYFEDDAEAQAFLYSGNAGGSVVYIKSDSPVEITGTAQIGSIDSPVVVVIDTPEGTNNGWDQRGTSDFFGVVVVKGNIEVRGTSGVYGGMIASGAIESRGLGTTWEINYNQKVFDAINGQYVISVNIVPNTWEEYTLPRTETTVEGS